MGEITEMKLDGTLCEHCGSFIGDEVGYPRWCSPPCLLNIYPNINREGIRKYFKREKINKNGEGPRDEYEKGRIQ